MLGDGCWVRMLKGVIQSAAPECSPAPSFQKSSPSKMTSKMDPTFTIIEFHFIVHMCVCVSDKRTAASVGASPLWWTMSRGTKCVSAVSCPPEDHLPAFICSGFPYVLGLTAETGRQACKRSSLGCGKRIRQSHDVGPTAASCNEDFSRRR